MDKKKLSKIHNFVNLLAPSTIRFLRLPQRYDKADLEWDEPQRGELARQVAGKNKYINLKVFGQDNNELNFCIKTTTRMGKL